MWRDKVAWVETGLCGTLNAKMRTLHGFLRITSSHWNNLKTVTTFSSFKNLEHVVPGILPVTEGININKKQSFPLKVSVLQIEIVSIRNENKKTD